MWAVRADRARRDIAALACEGATVAEVHAAALGLVQRAVPFSQACWAGVDPESFVLTEVTNWPPWPQPAEIMSRYADLEASGTEPHPYPQLSRRRTTVARLSDLPGHIVAGSARLHDLLLPQSLAHEVRAAFVVDDACWAVGGLFREPGRDFNDRETEFIAAITSAVAAATRVAVRAHAGPARRDVDGPVILLVGSGGQVHAATTVAATWLAAVEEHAPGRVSMTLYAVAAGALACASGTARARMRDVDGGWVVLQAARLVVGDEPGRIAVTVQPAPAADIVRLRLAAYGATPREQEVCSATLAGLSTAGIGDRLAISPHTVQDHLKALFAKVGVRSRSELAARLQA